MKRVTDGKVIGLDTMVFIYHLEDFPALASVTEQLFADIEKGKCRAVTSFVTLLEILVKPKTEGNRKVVSDYRELLLSFPNLQFLPLGLEVSDLASTLRAKYSIRTPDAVQVATVISAGADYFITNDEALKKVTEIEILLLKELKK